MEQIPVKAKPKVRILPSTAKIRKKKEDGMIKLNNYDYTPEYLDLLKNYLQTKQLPDTWSDNKIITFRRRYGKNWKLVNDKIIYTPKNLEVVYKKDISNTLLNLYTDPKVGIGMGIRSFYNKVVDQYLGIKRNNIEEFIKGQTSYQLTKAPTKVTNKPIITEFPNDRWQSDLIDMSNLGNNNFLKDLSQNWILTVIDNFSKYVFAVPLPSKKARYVLQGYKDIIEHQAGGTKPRTLQTDNGPEFANKTIQTWAKDQNIHLSRSATYQPTSNALIENFNNILRKMIREGFVRNNSLNWVNHLSDYLYNRNHSKHGTTKYQPIELWRQGREKLTKANTTPELLEASDRIQDKAKKALNRNKAGDLKVGDQVRILLSAISSATRKIIKEGRQKLLPVKFTTDIYTIRAIVPEEEFIKKRYIVQKNGEDVITEKKRASTPRRTQLFFGTELQKVDTNSKELITTDDMEKLNKIEYTTKEKVVPEKNVIQTRSRVKAEKEKAEPKVKVHQTRSREKNSPEPIDVPPKKKAPPKPKPIDVPPATHFNLRARKKVSYKV
jgi:hypothetical protein